MMNARDWKTNEPGGEFLLNERPESPTHIGDALKAKGFTEERIAEIAGAASSANNPFRPTPSRPRAL
jgi:hypothetical protein